MDPDSSPHLPADHAFVLQLEGSPDRPIISHRGRVEHLASGRATRFQGTCELWAFVDGTLRQYVLGGSDSPDGDDSR